MQSLYTLEIACFSLAGMQVAIANGAHRIELCENPAEGGTTPSYGTLVMARQLAGTIPVFPIIRPRGGHFYYDKQEVAAMLQDVMLCKKLGFEGVVLGALHNNGTVDVATTRRLVEAAYPMEVTFHRAFDRTPVLQEALEAVIQCGCQRILTSGGLPTAPQAASQIAALVQQAHGRIIMMPGSGVKSSNVANLAAITGAVEFHTAARTQSSLIGIYNPKAMEEQPSFTTVDAQEVQNLRKQLKHYFEGVAQQ